MKLVLRLFAILLPVLICAACNGGSLQNLVADPHEAPAQSAAAELWPDSLPQDGVQPWEVLSSDGFVMSAANTDVAGAAAGPRGASALDADSEFAPGVERFLEGGSVTDNGEASTLSSAADSLSYAMYRLPLGGLALGIASVDVNLLAGTGYFIGLSDYGNAGWQWFGPFADNHVRLSAVLEARPSADFISPLGNTFITVAAFDGAAVDVVGVGANPVNGADTTPPPDPGTPSATPAGGGVLLEWLPVSAGDLAGYRVYYSDSTFATGTEAGVSHVQSLEGLSSHLLRASGTTFVRISAVDISGNESALSPVASATPLAAGGTAGVTASVPSGGLNDSIAITATGGETYDFDVDGDGLYDITGTASTTASADTTSTGIIRPHVRAYSGGVMTAQGGVSLIIAANSRPVAMAVAFPMIGPVPLEVTFVGTAEDAEDAPEDLSFAWDFDGDGFFDEGQDTLNPLPQAYTFPGLYGPKFRVLDTDGAWDVDTLAILATGIDPFNESPTASLSVDLQYGDAGTTFAFDASGSADEDGSIALYEYDFDGDGLYDAYGTASVVSHVYNQAGVFTAQLRVTDDSGATANSSALVRVNEPLDLSRPWGGFGRDQRHTRRSPYIGSQANSSHWTHPFSGNVLTTPAVAADGTVYVGIHTLNTLYALDINGGVLWSYTAGGLIDSSPTLGPDGTIYFGSNDNNLYALDPDGLLLWQYTTSGDIFSSPAVGDDGTVYVGSLDGNVYALNPDGTFKWAFPTGGEVWSSPAIGADGTVYCGSGVGSLFAISKSGTIVWEYPTGDFVFSSPAIGPDGTVYVGSYDNNLYAINPDGTLQWSYLTGDNVQSSPAIGADGTIYVGSDDNNLYAINPDGSLQWNHTTGNNVYSSPAIGADGTIYFGSFDHKLYAVHPNGLLYWSGTTGDTIWSSPAIGADGIVYVGSFDNSLYAYGPS